MTLLNHRVRDTIGVVVIGRNEGVRLEACLNRLARFDCPTIYVDSGSTDNSVPTAEMTGAAVVELDRTIPFTAARARNVGWRRLLDDFPKLQFVQFLDGDCIPATGWLETAMNTLDQNPDVGAVCGRRREDDPRHSAYNLLCDIEWDGPVGDIEEFGGGVLIRREALQQVDGYIDSVIAAEDTEFSVRLRKSGWRLLRIPAEMEQHDAKMTQFKQWWKRAVRSGHAHAEMHARHGASPFRCRTRATRSCLTWGLIVPSLALIMAWPTGGWSLLLCAGYLLLFFRILFRSARRMPFRNACIFAAFCILAKVPEGIGLLTFWFNRLTGRQAEIIEYKPIPNNAKPIQA